MLTRNPGHQRLNLHVSLAHNSGMLAVKADGKYLVTCHAARKVKSPRFGLFVAARIYLNLHARPLTPFLGCSRVLHLLTAINFALRLIGTGGE